MSKRKSLKTHLRRWLRWPRRLMRRTGSLCRRINNLILTLRVKKMTGRFYCNRFFTIRTITRQWEMSIRDLKPLLRKTRWRKINLISFPMQDLISQWIPSWRIANKMKAQLLVKCQVKKALRELENTIIQVWSMEKEQALHRWEMQIDLGLQRWISNRLLMVYKDHKLERMVCKEVRDSQPRILWVDLHQLLQLLVELLVQESHRIKSL